MGVNITINASQVATVETAETIFAIIGTDTRSAGAIAHATPTLIRTAAELASTLGTPTDTVPAAGSLHALVSDIYAVRQAPTWVAAYDDTLTGSALDDAVTACLDALPQLPGLPDAKPSDILLDAVYPTTGTAASDVTAKLNSVVKSLDAVGYLPTPVSSVANAVTWAGNNRHDQLLALFGERQGNGGWLTWGGNLFGSIAGQDSTPGMGFKEEPGTILPITSISALRPSHSFSPSGTTADNALLAAAGIASLYQSSSGYYRWKGALGATAPFDSVSVRRVVDRIAAKAVSLSAPFITRVDLDRQGRRLVAQINGYLRHLVSLGNIRAGTAAIDEGRQTDAARASGQLWLVLTIDVYHPVDSINLAIDLLN